MKRRSFNVGPTTFKVHCEIFEYESGALNISNIQKKFQEQNTWTTGYIIFGPTSMTRGSNHTFDWQKSPTRRHVN